MAANTQQPLVPCFCYMVWKNAYQVKPDQKAKHDTIAGLTAPMTAESRLPTLLKSRGYADGILLFS
jgi:hypothetical protein